MSVAARTGCGGDRGATAAAASKNVYKQCAAMPFKTTAAPNCTEDCGLPHLLHLQLPQPKLTSATTQWRRHAKTPKDHAAVAKLVSWLNRSLGNGRNRNGPAAAAAATTASRVADDLIHSGMVDGRTGS